MKDRKKRNRSKFGYGLIAVLVIGMVFGYMTIPRPVLQVDEDTGEWHIVWEGNLASAAEANPGTGASGFLSVYFHPHQATPHASYFENSSSNLESNCTTNSLGFANADDTEVDLAHSTTFDVVVRARGNVSNCQVGGTWFDTNLKVQWTSASLAVSADTELSLVGGNASATSNDSAFTYMYMNFWDDNGGTGYTISQDQSLEITSIKLLAYY